MGTKTYSFGQIIDAALAAGASAMFVGEAVMRKAAKCPKVKDSPHIMTPQVKLVLDKHMPENIAVLVRPRSVPDVGYELLAVLELGPDDETD